MYAREENNQIVRYSTLPREVRHNGQLVMNVRNADAQTLAGLGFYPLATPSYDSRTHKRGNVIEWDADNERYTYTVESLNKTVDDIKEELRSQLKGYWKIAFEEGKPYSDFLKATNQTMPADVQTKINEAYTLLATLRAQINGLATMEAALAFEFPMNDINEKLDYMKSLI